MKLEMKKLAKFALLSNSKLPACKWSDIRHRCERIGPNKGCHCQKISFGSSLRLHTMLEWQNNFRFPRF
jgi:hypothetical protein